MVDALSSGEAVSRAGLSRAILSSPTLTTKAGTIVTVAVTRAIEGTFLQRTIKTVVVLLSAAAGRILTDTVKAAAWWADLGRAVKTRPSRLAIADSLKAVSVTSTHLGASGDITKLSRESRIASAGSVITVLVFPASTRANFERAIITHKSDFTLACEMYTATTARALVGANGVRAINSRISQLAEAR